MYGKIQLTGKITVETGMHIWGSNQFSAIGSVDAAIIRDIITNLPMIPGSSLKGKMRALLAKKYNQNRIVDKHDEDNELILRLFGSAKKGNIKASRLIFSDMIMNNMSELNAIGVNSATEIKFENTINRLTAVANPRQIERAIRGSAFELNIIYNADKEDEIIKDFEVIKEGLNLLQYDYIGGNGSRGYGKIKISNLNVKTVAGDVADEIINNCKMIIKEV